VLPGLAFVASVPWLPLDVLNRYAYTGVAVAFVALVVATADRSPLPFASSRAVRAVALSSYSVYMTHTVAADAYRRLVMDTYPAAPAVLHVALALTVIGLVGATFYAAVERPALVVRRRLAPRRPERPSSGLVTVG
jgi:peptidoglycan/LPS O-acetylase OafA/YrhL